MRLHIELDEELVAQIEELSGPRGRSAFVRSAIERQFARTFDGLTSKPQPAPSSITITSGIPTRRLGCDSGVPALSRPG
jgi:hypothetical protein